MYSNLIIVNSEFEKKNLLKKLKFSKYVEIIKHGVNIQKKIINSKKKKN